MRDITHKDLQGIGQGGAIAAYYPIIGAPGEESPFPFGPDFFRRRFFEYMREQCELDTSKSQVLEIVLASGGTLDVCHIVEVAQDYLLLAVFLDTRSCEDIYHTYIRYDTIFQINVIGTPTSSRPVGFDPKYQTTFSSASSASGQGRRKGKTRKSD